MKLLLHHVLQSVRSKRHRSIPMPFAETGWDCAASAVSLSASASVRTRQSKISRKFAPLANVLYDVLRYRQQAQFGYYLLLRGEDMACNLRSNIGIANFFALFSWGCCWGGCETALRQWKGLLCGKNAILSCASVC
ncbi:MAG: hypothetical protein RSK76_12035, partial [Clostridia bacterium]